MTTAGGLRDAADDRSAEALSSCAVSRRSARRLLRAWTIEDLRRLAEKRLPRAVFDFFDGGAEDETTLRDNRAAFERARLLGYDALMVTVDVPVGGKRERDFRNDFAIRFRFTPRNVLDFASRPGWVLSVLRHGMPALENVADLAPDAKSIAEIASSVGSFWDAGFDWDGLKETRDRWPGKMLV